MTTADGFREWQPEEWFDRGFLTLVPSSARKEFLRAVRPLSDASSTRLTEALFAGIKQPFHYLRANGWMAQLMRSKDRSPADASFDQCAAMMQSRLAWPATDVVLLVYHQPTVFAMRWESFLYYFRQDWLNLDTMLVCHPKARESVLFWEDQGPFFGKRGHRELPCPFWDDPDLPRTKDEA
jgi:hypothetical protein